MLEELFIDEQGRFQMPTEDLAAFLEVLRANKIHGSAETPSAFTSGGQSFGYGRLQNLYDADMAVELHHQWRSFQEDRTTGHVHTT